MHRRRTLSLIPSLLAPIHRGPTHPTLALLLILPLVSAGCDGGPTEPREEIDDLPVLEWVLDQEAVPDLNGVWSEGEWVVAAGENGQILVYDGTGWSDLSPPGFNGELSDVWGTPDHGLFATAWDNFLLRYDGSSWTVEKAPVSGDTQLYAVWGASPTDVFAVGYSGDVFHFDGAGWSLMETPTWANLVDVWGFSGDDVYAVGTGNAIIHYDGTGWSPMSTPPAVKPLSGVWGAAPDDIYAVGADAAVLHYDGTAWSALDLGWDAHFNDVWGTSSSDVWITGSESSGIDRAGIVLHYDGSTWTGLTSSQSVASVHGNGPGDVWMVGDEGTVLHFDGSQLATVREGMGRNLYGVFGFGPESVYAVGEGVVLRSPQGGSGWIAVVSDEESVHRDLWGTSASDLFVGGGGINYLMRIQSGSWTRQVPSGGWGTYNGVWGFSSADVFAVGSRIMHFDGTAWSVMLGEDAGFEFGGVWGASPSDVWVVQDRIPPHMMHFDGSAWNEVEPPEVFWDGSMRPPYLEGIWGSSATDVFAVGAPGAILHFDGTAWSAMSSGTDVLLNAVGGSSPVNVYAVGEDCTVLHYDGVAWEDISPAMDCRVSLNGVWLAPGSDVIVVGDAGTILRGIR